MALLLTTATEHLEALVMALEKFLLMPTLQLLHTTLPGEDVPDLGLAVRLHLLSEAVACRKAVPLRGRTQDLHRKAVLLKPRGQGGSLTKEEGGQQHKHLDDRSKEGVGVLSPSPYLTGDHEGTP